MGPAQVHDQLLHDLSTLPTLGIARQGLFIYTLIMKNFFNKVWVQVVAWIFLVIGTLALILGGTAVGDIVRVPELVFGIVEAVGLLIIFIKSMLQKKDTDKK